MKPVLFNNTMFPSQSALARYLSPNDSTLAKTINRKISRLTLAGVTKLVLTDFPNAKPQQKSIIFVDGENISKQGFKWLTETITPNDTVCMVYAMTNPTQIKKLASRLPNYVDCRINPIKGSKDLSDQAIQFKAYQAVVEGYTHVGIVSNDAGLFKTFILINHFVDTRMVRFTMYVDTSRGVNSRIESKNNITVHDLYSNQPVEA